MSHIQLFLVERSKSHNQRSKHFISLMETDSTTIHELLLSLKFVARCRHWYQLSRKKANGRRHREDAENSDRRLN